MKGGESVTEFNDVDESVQIVGGHDEAVPLEGVTPPTHRQIPTKAALQGARQMFVEDRVEVVVISTRVAIELRREASVRMINALRAVVECKNNALL